MCFRSHPVTAAYTRGARSAARTPSGRLHVVGDGDNGDDPDRRRAIHDGAHAVGVLGAAGIEMGAHNDVFVSVIWLSIALGGAGFAQTLAWTVATDIGRAHTSAVGSWMNAWGFVAAAIVLTLAPIIAQQLGWTSVIVANAAVTVLGIVGFLLTRTNQPLHDSAGPPARV